MTLTGKSMFMAKAGASVGYMDDYDLVEYQEKVLDEQTDDYAGFPYGVEDGTA